MPLVVVLLLLNAAGNTTGRWAFRFAARIGTYSRVFALDLDQALPDAGGAFNGLSQRCLKLTATSSSVALL